MIGVAESGCVNLVGWPRRNVVVGFLFVGESDAVLAAGGRRRDGDLRGATFCSVCVEIPDSMIVRVLNDECTLRVGRGTR